MPDVLTLRSTYFELTIWTKDVSRAQSQLQKTSERRGASNFSGCTIRFLPSLAVDYVDPSCPQASTSEPVSELVLPTALFFENKPYDFEFVFSKEVSLSIAPKVLHRLRSVEDSFRIKGRSLRGTINFGNDIGWFRLGVCFAVGQRPVYHYISFEVVPTKLDVRTDLESIRRAVDEYYPLWCFSFAQKTEQKTSIARRPHERFELLWMAHFEKLRVDLLKAVQQICRAPRARLVVHERRVAAEMLRGRLMPKLEELVATHLASNDSQHTYRLSNKRLSLDTQENRFVRMVLVRCQRDLARFLERARNILASPDKSRVSESFLSELEDWRRPLERLLNRPMFAEVGLFEGFDSESLVMQQGTGYSTVYRIWQELKSYLELFGGGASISMKSVADLYEVWCLLEVRRVLLDLGFVAVKENRATLRTVGFDRLLASGKGAAFHLTRDDGVSLRLSHEPFFSPELNPKVGNIYSWTTSQRPDILLEATFPTGESLQWIFDAKYRLENEDDDIDRVPDDAINQMHRYRDALIFINRADDGEREKRRPILGAFVLYPGFFDESISVNPYGDAIEAVGIGGFPALPGRPNLWLREFLAAKFGRLDRASAMSGPDRFFAEDSARIAPLGTKISRYSELTLAAPLGPTAERDRQYIQRFRNGTASWYHIPLSTTDRRSVVRNAMREIRYCAVAVPNDDQKLAIEFLYEVKSIRLVQRGQLSIEQSGKSVPSSAEYWLLELGYSRPITIPIFLPNDGFVFRLTDAEAVLAGKCWGDLPVRYGNLD